MDSVRIDLCENIIRKVCSLSGGWLDAIHTIAEVNSITRDEWLYLGDRLDDIIEERGLRDDEGNI